MALGDIVWQTLKIGSLDVLNSEVSVYGVDIYERIDDPIGSPLMEINVADPIDALNKYKITGSYDSNQVEVKFKYQPTGGIIGFTGRINSVVAVMDRMGDASVSSGHMKQYQIRVMQPEYFRANGKRITGAFSGPTTQHAEKIIKEFSDKPIRTDVTSEPRVKTYGRVAPVDALQQSLFEHSAPQSKSSAFVIFQQWKNGSPTIVQTTYDKLFEQQSVVELKERTDLNASGASELDAQNAILYGNYSPSWSEVRPAAGAKNTSINLSTHSVIDPKPKQDTTTEKPAFKTITYSEDVPNHRIEDTANNTEKHSTSESVRKRQQYLAHLSQGEATIEITGNDKIYLGCKVKVSIPKKTDDNASGGEGQFNNDALVVGIRHKIKPAGQNPRYTMVLELLKGGMEQGGQTG